MTDVSGNLQTVAKALHGITGVEPEAPPPGPDRYLVVARMRRELDTVDSLRRNAFAAYWPSYEWMMPARTSHGGFRGRKRQRVGIIPGYVFCAVHPSLDLFGVLDNIVGAIDIARSYSGDPLLIHDIDIQILRRIEAGLNTPRHPDRVQHTFKRGQKVRFLDDIFNHWPFGIVERLEHDGRISVEVDGMGRKLPITVLPHQIELV